MLFRTRRSRPPRALGSESDCGMGAGLDALGVGRNDSVLDVTEGVVRKVRAVVNADVEAVEAAEAGCSLSGVLSRSRSTDVKLRTILINEVSGNVTHQACL